MTSFVVGGVPEPMNLPWQLAIADGTFAQRAARGRVGRSTGRHRRDRRSARPSAPSTSPRSSPKARSPPSSTAPTFASARSGYRARSSGASMSPATAPPARFTTSSPCDSPCRDSVRDRISWPIYSRHATAFDLGADQLVVVGDIDGARAALREDRADVFLWEKYVTSPLVHRGEFRRIDTIDTPWPSFAIAVHVDTLASRARDLDHLIAVAQRAAARLRQDPNATAHIVSRYGLTQRDARRLARRMPFRRHNRACRPSSSTMCRTVSSASAPSRRRRPADRDRGPSGPLSGNGPERPSERNVARAGR